MVGGVSVTPAVSPWPEEEEESDPGQVSDILLSFGAPWVGGVKGLEDGDRDGTDSCQWGVLFGIGGKFLAQPKVGIYQRVMPRIAGSHGCKYLSDGNKEFFRVSLIYGYPAGCQKAGAHTLG